MMLKEGAEVGTGKEEGNRVEGRWGGGREQEKNDKKLVGWRKGLEDLGDAVSATSNILEWTKA